MIAKVRSLFRRAVSADIVKVFSLTAVSTLVKMLTGLISVKVVAVIVGPSGIALIGQLNNFSSMLMNLACGGINSGVTKYIAEYRESEQKVKVLLSVALRITIVCSVVCGGIMIVLNRWLSSVILLTDEYGYVFLIFGLTIILYAFNMLISSILNGYKEFKKYVSVNIVGSLIGVFFTLCLVLQGGLKGALISAVTFQSIMFFISLWMVRKLPWVRWDYFKARFDKDVAKKYYKYSLMTLVAASIGPLSQLFLRGYVITNISAVEAGWWEAMNRISGMYLMVVTMSFGVYYLPRLSELKDQRGLRREIFTAYKIIIPTLLIGFLLIYYLRFLVIKVLFTSDFISMESLFVWQLFGDLFKIASWLLAYVMVAKSMTKIFVVTEIFFSIFYVLLSLAFIRFNGLIGITQAYFVNYVIYWITMIFIFRKLLMLKKG